jgi:hypothetical protein
MISVIRSVEPLMPSRNMNCPARPLGLTSSSCKCVTHDTSELPESTCPSIFPKCACVYNFQSQADILADCNTEDTSRRHSSSWTALTSVASCSQHTQTRAKANYCKRLAWHDDIALSLSLSRKRLSSPFRRTLRDAEQATEDAVRTC